MVTVERQLHGYRQGHQLLAGSMTLPKEDQSTIDRLSDVAGPLRPREKFEPYLSGYPLPSGDHYVLARTCQDLTVTRAGCVRTISLIIPVSEWGDAKDLQPFLDLLQSDKLPDDEDATQVVLGSLTARPLPPVRDFKGSELLEALFLEDAQPVVLFDAPSPELVATRLLTALWPSLRQQFAVSTFALSPRRVGGRDFDLVFAPKDARAKFSDWSGRRIDGRSSQDARHRWTGAIVDRVFNAPQPQLLSSRYDGLLEADGNAGDNAAALRIALLWDELLSKLDTTPTAALGLLDIANSGKVRASFAQKVLEPPLSDAVRRVPTNLPEDDAWNFLSAIALKLQGRPMPRGIEAVDAAVADLAERAPEGAVALLSQPDDRGAMAGLLPIIADGIGAGFADRAEHALLSAPPELLGRLIAGSGRLAAKVAADAALIDRLGEVLPLLEPALAASIGEELLSHLVEEWQAPAARPLIDRLNAEELAAEVAHLGAINDFAAPDLISFCVNRARKIDAKTAILDALARLPASARRNGLISSTLDPSVADAEWLLRRSGLPADLSTSVFVELLRHADDRQFDTILRSAQVSGDAIRVAEQAAPDLLRRIIFIDKLPLDVFVRVMRDVFAKATPDEKVRFGKWALQRVLAHRFGGEEIAFIATMLGGVGEHLDGAWVARLGLGKEIGSAIASRNMVAFRKAPQPARLRFVWSIGEAAQVLHERRSFDLDAAACEAFALFLFDAEKVTPQSALTASGYLLPMLMRQPKDPVSLIVAAGFPIVYRELAKKDDVPDLLKFIPFFDWDRCKAARYELVTAFISSSWSPGHLALTACRCDDVSRILRRTAKTFNGEQYLDRIASDLGRVSDKCRSGVESVIASIRSDWSSKYDWRD